ncbi:TRAP transporter large permease [Nisaea sediminum]|uniref:TRAP transporter large permease n=1 Tax=Nisaea sediminum TaxID=2775867 RepID=UPI001868C7FD|nr:TRAP transporter large permease [Nisaea sediminum]
MSLAVGTIGSLVLIAAILSGANVMVALALVGAIGLAIIGDFNVATALMGSVFFDTTHSFNFSVIPMFLLMGFFAMRAGLGQDMFDAATKWLGGLRGGLAISTTIGAAAFGAAAGSSVGSATIFTRLALPEMLARGYDKRLASASIAISGTLAVMIPPSALMVVYGILTDTSIGGLLLAGVIPGFTFAFILCFATYLWVRIYPESAPQMVERFTMREKMASLRLVGPLLLVIVVIILGLYLGFFTPTEAGGVGALVTLILAAIRHRGLKGVELTETLLDTVKTSGMIFAIIIAAILFSKFLAFSGVTHALGGFLTGLETNRWVIVGFIVLIYLVLGMLMDAPGLLAITLPITHPVMLGLGFDEIWVGVFVVLLCELGAVTPPVGINCFVVQAASEGRVELDEVFRGLTPFFLAGLVMLVLLCLFPEIATFLPDTMKQ